MSKKKIRRPKPYKKPQERTLKESWQAMSEGTRKGIIWGCIAVVAVVALLLIYYYAIYDDGSLVVRNSAVVGAEDTWLIGARDSGKNSTYYHFADVATPEGYTVAESSGDSGQAHSFTFEKDDISVSVRAVNNTVDGIVGSAYPLISNYVGENGSITEVSDFESPLGAGKYYTYTTSYTDDENVEHFSKSLAMYVPSSFKDGCILISSYAQTEAADALPADDVLLARAQEVLAGVTLPEK